MSASMSFIQSAGPAEIGLLTSNSIHAPHRDAAKAASATVRTSAGKGGAALDARLDRAIQRQITEKLAAAESAKSALKNIEENLQKLMSLSGSDAPESLAGRMTAEMRERALDELRVLDEILTPFRQQDIHALSALNKAIKDLGQATKSPVERYAELTLALEGALGAIEGPRMLTTAALEELQAKADKVSSEIDRQRPAEDMDWMNTVMQTLQRRSAEGIQTAGTGLLRNGGATPDPAKVSALLDTDD